MSKGRVLNVEDDEEARMAGNRRLQKIGYEVISAADGEEGVRRFEEETNAGRKIDLVITDINMSKMNGWELITALREGEKSKVPIALSTGSNIHEETMERFNILGCFGYVGSDLIKVYETWRQKNETNN